MSSPIHFAKCYIKGIILLLTYGNLKIDIMCTARTRARAHVCVHTLMSIFIFFILTEQILKIYSSIKPIK